MICNNNLLGQFTLTDVQAAPQGLPMIDVIFEIDANGILDVSAVERSTGDGKHLIVPI